MTLSLLECRSRPRLKQRHAPHARQSSNRGLSHCNDLTGVGARSDKLVDRYRHSTPAGEESPEGLRPCPGYRYHHYNLTYFNIVVTCWVGQNPRLQAKASAFLDTRQGGIEGARLYDLGA